MGHSYAKLPVYDKSLRRAEEVELLVDTGSTYTWIPKQLMERLGIVPTTKRKFRTMDGRLLEREIAEAILDYEGEKATRIVVFALEGDATVLGVDALEGLMLEVDPTTKRLKRLEAALAI